MEFSRTDTKVIKGIAIILMLYHHLFAFPDRIAEDILYIPLLRIGERSIDYYIGVFGKICVSLFLFLGGYGTYISTQKTPYDATRTLKIVLKKIKALYFEYWKVFFVFIPLCMLLDVSSMEKNVKIFCLNLVGLSTSYCGEWWFFTAYIGLLAVSPIVFSILEKSSCAIIDFIGLILFDIFVKCVLPELYECTWVMRIENNLLWITCRLILETGSVFVTGCIFAKYNLLEDLKRFFRRNNWCICLSIVLMCMIFCIRIKTGAKFEIISAPVFTGTAIAVVDWIPWKLPYKLLQKIGEEGTIIWLVHSIYCYLLCQRIVFLPRYSVLICIWLLFMSYCTSILLGKAVTLGNRLYKKCFM